jgi:3-phosphoshikimate 1-carboxyvinyltransferase
VSASVRVRAAARALHGTLRVPGDKSITHRALLGAALAEGRSTIRGFPGGADVRATLAAIQALGARVRWAGETVEVTGAGLALGADRDVALECGNSGTTMRLGMGLVAGVTGRCILDGDASLRRRPMERVATPLRAMGAHIATTDGRAPVTVVGRPLAGIEWTSPIASAQVKSAVLLAGLRARGATTVHEPLPTRDHTERLLAHQGVGIVRDDRNVRIEPARQLTPLDLTLPGDPSSAAFLVVAALLVPGSQLRIDGVATNRLRTGALEILRRMGARVVVETTHEEAGEPCGVIHVEHGPLTATTIEPAEIPGAIDELPILAIAASMATGETRVVGAGELRVKESDRIAALEQLATLGVDFVGTRDGFVVRGAPGEPLETGRIATQGDHRIAMAFAIAGLRAPGGVTIDDPQCVDVSFPGFFDVLRGLDVPIDQDAS